MATTFEAIIGAMEDKARAQRLVLDLVAIQLQGEDLSEIWDIADPMNTLASVLSNEKRGEPEARLLWVSGKETLLACYHVGIYSDKELIGQGKATHRENFFFCHLSFRAAKLLDYCSLFCNFYFTNNCWVLAMIIVQNHQEEEEEESCTQKIYWIFVCFSTWRNGTNSRGNGGSRCLTKAFQVRLSLKTTSIRKTNT